MDEVNKAHAAWMASMLETNAAARRVGDSMEFNDVGDTDTLLAEYRRCREHEFKLFRDFRRIEYLASNPVQYTPF